MSSAVHTVKQACSKPEEGHSVDPFGLCVGGHLGSEGRAHGLKQGGAVMQGAC